MVFDDYRKRGVWRKKEPRTREEWEAAWTLIKPVFADLLVSEIDFAACDEFYTGLEKFSLQAPPRLQHLSRPAQRRHRLQTDHHQSDAEDPQHCPQGSCRNLVRAGD